MKAAKAAAILIPLVLLSGLVYGAYRFFGSGFRVNAPPAAPVAKQAERLAETRTEPKEAAEGKKALAILEDHDGELVIFRGGKTADVRPKMELLEGDAIEVGPWSSARILWLGYGRTVIDEGSRVVISRAAGREGAWTARLKLEGGRIWTRFENLMLDGSSFEVRSGSLITSVRGTSFGVERTLQDVKVTVTESSVAAFYVRDREPTSEERARGMTEPVEETVGEPVTVAAGQQVTTAADLPDQDLTPLIPSPVPATGLETDLFIKGADVPATPDELEGRAPSVKPAEASGSGSSTGGTADGGGLNLLNVTPQ